MAARAIKTASKEKLSKEQFKELFQELDQAHDKLARIEGLFFERKGAHVAACEAVMWISVTRAKTMQLLQEQFPQISRAEYYEITGKNRS